MVRAGVHLGPRYNALFAGFRAASPRDLLVATDFDQTLTTFRGVDGSPGLQCHDILLQHLDLDAVPGMRERVAPLIEWHNMPEPQRMRSCGGCQVQRAERTQWFFDAFAAAASEFGVAEQVPGCVERGNTQFRGGLARVVEWLTAHEVPLFVVSAGLRQVIEVLLERAGIGLSPKSCRIVANDLGDPVSRVTSRNKSGALQLVPDLAEMCSNRTWVLLLGDKPSDCAVAAGLPSGSQVQVLRVGFVQTLEPEKEVLEEYLRHFDVLLTGDPPMDFVLELLASMGTAE